MLLITREMSKIKSLEAIMQMSLVANILYIYFLDGIIRMVIVNKTKHTIINVYFFPVWLKVD